MADKINMVMGKARWDGIAESRNFSEVCAGYPKEKDFWSLLEDGDRIIGFEKYMKVLDLGCGPGRLAKVISSQVGFYYGADVHEELIGIAEEHYKDYKNVIFIKHDGVSLPMFGNETIDYIYERLMFIHITKEVIIKYLSEAERVLKKGGILNIPDMPFDERWVNGFTEKEIRDLLSNFQKVEISMGENTFIVWAVK